MKLKRTKKKFNQFYNKNKNYYNGIIIYNYLDGEMADGYDLYDNVPELDTYTYFEGEKYKLYKVEYYETHRLCANLYYEKMYPVKVTFNYREEQC